MAATNESAAERDRRKRANRADRQKELCPQCGINLKRVSTQRCGSCQRKDAIRAATIARVAKADRYADGFNPLAPWRTVADRNKLIRRLLANVDVHDTTGCWLWKGTRDQQGRPVFNICGQTRIAYRALYELFRAPIPEGKILDHVVCDNGHGGCANPWHVEPATNRENILRGRGLAAQQLLRTHCPRGHPYDVVRISSRNGQPRRYCSRCNYESQRRSRLRIAAKAKAIA